MRLPALLAALVLGAFGIGVLQASAQTYPGGDLPPNVLAAGLDGLPIDADSSPVINDPQPVISGQVAESDGFVTITITSDEQTFVAATDSEGRFSARVPEPLDDGLHTLYFDGARIGTFTVVTGAATPTVTATATASPTTTPAPPATGSGTSASGQLPLAGAGLVGLAIGGAVLAMWALRKRVDVA